MTINLPIDNASLLNVDQQEFTARLTEMAQQLLAKMSHSERQAKKTKQSAVWWRTYEVGEETMRLTMPQRVDMPTDYKRAIDEALLEKYQ